jgi:hypothetical protein
MRVIQFLLIVISIGWLAAFIWFVWFANKVGDISAFNDHDDFDDNEL